MIEAGNVKKTEKFETPIQKVSFNNSIEKITDTLAVEEPLEIRLGFNGDEHSVSITMRTPGNDFELASGFLFTEGILKSKDQIKSIKHCTTFPPSENIIRVDLSSETSVDLRKLDRNFYTTSSCGVCGKSSLDALFNAGAKRIENNSNYNISAEIIHSFPKKLRDSQDIFELTGGLHAAALFDFSGNLIDLREDVGRHNAVDKLIGKQFLEDNLPLSDKILFLSGRASFELIQKAVMAQIPLICAVGAPSSLAFETAENFGVSLLGFVRDNRFNVYTNFEKINYETTAS